MNNAQVPNRAKAYLRERGQTVADFEGVCGELADVVIGPGDDVLYVEGFGAWAWGWRFHQVPLIGGLVHDAWCEGEHARTIPDWLATMFASCEIELSINGDTIYQGPADAFKEDTFTAEERLAFVKLFEYVDCERESYADNPAKDHIWLQIEKVKAAVERITNRGDAEAQSTEAESLSADRWLKENA